MSADNVRNLLNAIHRLVQEELIDYSRELDRDEWDFVQVSDERFGTPLNLARIHLYELLCTVVNEESSDEH